MVQSGPKVVHWGPLGTDSILSASAAHFLCVVFTLPMLPFLVTVGGVSGSIVNPICVVQWLGEFLAQKSKVEVYLPDIFCDTITYPDNVTISARSKAELTITTSADCTEADYETFSLQFASLVVNARADERICNPPPTDLFLVYRDLLVYGGQDLFAAGSTFLANLYDGHDHSDHSGDDDHYADGHTHGDKSFALETSVVLSLVALAIRVL